MSRFPPAEINLNPGAARCIFRKAEPWFVLGAVSRTAEEPSQVLPGCMGAGRALQHPTDELLPGGFGSWRGPFPGFPQGVEQLGDCQMPQVRYTSCSFILHASLYSTAVYVLGMDWVLEETKMRNVWSFGGPSWSFRKRRCVVDRYKGIKPL